MASALLPLLRLLPDGAPERLRAVLAEVDPSALLAEASAHGLVGLLAETVGALGASLGPEHDAALSGRVRAAAAAGLRVKATLLRALDALAPVGVTPVVLKGLGLSARLYPTPLSRACHDVDLLVAPDEAAPARAALAAAGFVEAGPGNGSVQELRLGPELLELHVRPLETLVSAEGAAALLARAPVAAFEGRPVRYLEPLDEAVYLSVHAANHLLQRLAWLYDLKLLLRSTPLEAQALADRARTLGCAREAWFALSAARRAVDAPVPAELLAALRPGPLTERWAGRVFSPEALAAQALTQGSWRWSATKVALLGRPAAVGRYLLGRRSRGH